MSIEENRLYKRQEVEQFLRVSRSTIYRLMESGQLPGYKVSSCWRYYGRDVIALMERARHSGAAA